MSEGNAALALALGAGAGLGLWYLLHDDERNDHDKTTPPETPADPAPAGTISSPVPATPGPACALRLDAAGLTADGLLVDVPSAVDRCKSARAAELVLADDAPTEVYVRLAAALQEAGITLRLSPRRNRRRNGRGRRYSRQGRTILRDGEPVLYLDRVDLGDQRFATTPHEADRLAQRVVDLLNGSGRARRQAAPSTDLTTFAATVHALARPIEENPTPDGRARGRFGRKVFLAAIRRALRDTDYARLAPEMIDRLLIDAHRAGLIELARADLVAAMDPAEVRASEIRHLEATYHFVVAERTDPRNATTHRIFVFRTAPKNGNSRTRFYEADPPTTWEDAKRRLVAAGLLDVRILLASEWVLAADPPLRVPPDRLRPLP